MSYKAYYEEGEYSQILYITDEGLDYDMCSCTCIYGSFYGRSKKNKGILCKHLKEAIKKEYRKIMGKKKDEQKRIP